MMNIPLGSIIVHFHSGNVSYPEQITFGAASGSKTDSLTDSPHELIDLRLGRAANTSHHIKKA